MLMLEAINRNLAEKIMGWSQVQGLKVWSTGEADHNNKSEMIGFYQWNPSGKEDQAFRALNQFLDNCSGKVSYQLTNTPTLQHTITLLQDGNVLIQITDTRASLAISRALYETIKNWDGR